MAKTGSNHYKLSKTLRISMLFTYFQPFSAGSTGSMNYAAGLAYTGVHRVERWTDLDIFAQISNF